VSLTLEQAEELNRTDLDFFASFCMPDVTTSAWPEFYKEVWLYMITQLYKLKHQRDPDYKDAQIGELFRFALGLPRGHAKTTFIKLLMVYCIIYGLIDFLLVIGANEQRGEDILTDVSDILCSDNVSQVYGSWKAGLGKDAKSIKTCRFNGREVILAAIGSGTSIRGLNVKNKRPQFILFDDAQTQANDESPAEREKLMRWVVGTAIKLRDPVRCAVFWVGNMYSEECILYKFHSSKKWASLVTGAILADRTALWPAIRTIESLMDEYEHDAEMGEADTWFAEIQNDPRGAKRGLLPDGNIPAPTIDIEEDLRLGSFVTIDPAGLKKNSDDNVITVHDVYADWKLNIPDLTARVLDPEAVIMQTINYVIEYRCSAIFVEGVAYQQTLAFWMVKYLAMYGLSDTVEVVELNPGKGAKLSRIRSWIKALLSGTSNISSPTVRSKVLFQAIQFKIDKTNNVDDILDCCSMGEMVKNKYQTKVHLTLEPGVVESKHRVQAHNTPINSRLRRSTHGIR